MTAVSTALTGNSALNGITSNAGTFVFSNGAGLNTPALTNTGTLDVDASGNGGSSLTVGGTLTNMGSVDVGNNGIAAAATLTVAALANSGTIYLTSGTAAATLKDTGAFGNTDFVEIDAFGGGGGSVLTISGALTNSSTLAIGNTSLSKATTVTAAGLANTGEINLTGGTATKATLDITAAAPATWTGTVDLTGDALLEFTGTTGITAIGTSADITLNGAATTSGAGKQQSNHRGQRIDDAVATNGGTLNLENGASLTTSGGQLTNNGTVEVDYFWEHRQQQLDDRRDPDQ